MAFNHYAKIKRILENEPDDWMIKRIERLAKILEVSVEDLPVVG